MSEIAALPMVIPSRGIHFFVSQGFRFPESKLKIVPDRSQMPPQNISVLSTILLSTPAQE